MTRIAPGGTRKSTGAPRARRSRNAVEDTSIRGIVTGRTSQPMSGSSAVSVARASTATVTASRKLLRPLPGIEPRRGVGTDDQEEVPVRGREVRDRVDRVRRARTVELECRSFEAVDVGDRRRDHGEARVGRRDDLPALLPRIAGDDEEHAIEVELIARFDRADQVTDVHRIERAAEDTKPLARTHMRSLGRSVIAS